MLCISHLLKILYSSNLSLVHSVALVTLPISQLFHMIYTHWRKNNHSSSGPSLGNISHIHEWERQHGESCLRRSRFLVKYEWHSRWYLTLVPGAISMRDQGRRLHESSYLHRESSGSTRHLLLIAKRNAFCVGQIYWCSKEWKSHDLKGMQHGLLYR